MVFKCIVIDDEWHGIDLLSELISSHPMLEVQETFLDVEVAIDYLATQGGVDFIFSDIGMPKLDGLSAAKFYRPFCRFLIYVTGYRHLSKEAFKENAAGILLKPVFDDDFDKLVNSLIPEGRI